MYRCFKLTIENSDFVQWNLIEQVEVWKRKGREIKENLRNRVNEILAEVTNSEGVIEGEKLSDTWFPIEKNDIFLSYSHNDEDLALTIAGFLNTVFGLRVFIDSLVWGSADELLRAIDNKYCLRPDGYYNYSDRNFSTSHVHAMLTTAIMRAIDRSEAIFFLNTSKSTYKLKEGFSEEHTLSPWIYEEIMCTSLLRERCWQDHRDESLNEAYHFEKALEMTYPLKLDSFSNIKFDTLICWEEKWFERKSYGVNKGTHYTLGETEHPLNVLYEMT